jgi:hypothetical protein
MTQRVLRIAVKVCGRLAVLAKRQPGLAFILALLIWKLFPMLFLAALGFAFPIVALLMVLLLLKRAAGEMCRPQFPQIVSLSSEE